MNNGDYNHFDLVEDIGNWYDCKDEIECKKITSGLFQKGIFLENL